MEGFDVIYTEHFSGVYRYVYSLCRDAALAEEITQEAFYKALENMDKFHGECRLFVWLCQIARNTYFSYLKKQKRRAPEAETARSASDPEAELLDRDAAWQLHRRLHRLPEPYKEVFSLRVFGELPFGKIGELFGKSDSWARLIFFRAKKELRRDLDESDL